MMSPENNRISISKSASLYGLKWGIGAIVLGIIPVLAGMIGVVQNGFKATQDSDNDFISVAVVTLMISACLTWAASHQATQASHKRRAGILAAIIVCGLGWGGFHVASIIAVICQLYPIPFDSITTLSVGDVVGNMLTNLVITVGIDVLLFIPAGAIGMLAGTLGAIFTDISRSRLEV